MAGILASVTDFIGNITGVDNDDPRLEQIMRKALPLCLLFVTGMIFYKYNDEKLSCMKYSGDDPVPDEFYHGYCWAKGIYIFRDLMDPVYGNLTGVAVGLPKLLVNNGRKMDTQGGNNVVVPCQTHNDRGERLDSCQYMHKVYYRQHHWLYQVLLGISIGMAVPYITHLIINNDLVGMQNDMTKRKDEEKKMIKIHDKYFSKLDSKANSVFKLFGSLIVKVTYLIVGILMFAYLNKGFEYRFGWYVIDLYKWMIVEHNLKLDPETADNQNLFSPGDTLLPVIGLCNFANTPHDKRSSDTGHADIITACEMNSNKLAQYWMVFVWFIMVGYIICAALNIIDYIKQCLCIIVTKQFRRYFSRRYHGKKKKKNAFEFLNIRQVFLLKSLEKSTPDFTDALSDMIISSHSTQNLRSPSSCEEATPNDIAMEERDMLHPTSKRGKHW